VETKLGKKILDKGLGWKRLLQVKLMGRGKILRDPARIGRLLATDLVVSLKPMGLQLSYMQEEVKSRISHSRCKWKVMALSSASPAWHRLKDILLWPTRHSILGMASLIGWQPEQALFMGFIRCLHES
jgi:hypothetical protein